MEAAARRMGGMWPEHSRPEADLPCNSKERTDLEALSADVEMAMHKAKTMGKNRILQKELKLAGSSGVETYNSVEPKKR